MSDPKREKFAQLCARGIPTVDAYERAGYRRNTGNSTAFRKRPDISKRITEIEFEIQNSSEQELEDYLRESGTSKAFIIKQLLETAQLAKDAGKYSTAVQAYKDVGAECFGMFMERKHLTVDTPSNVHSQTTTTINIENLNNALEGLAGPGQGLLEIDGHADVIDIAGELMAPEPIRHD